MHSTQEEQKQGKLWTDGPERGHVHARRGEKALDRRRVKLAETGLGRVHHAAARIAVVVGSLLVEPHTRAQNIHENTTCQQIIRANPSVTYFRVWSLIPRQVEDIQQCLPYNRVCCCCSAEPNASSSQTQRDNHSITTARQPSETRSFMVVRVPLLCRLKNLWVPTSSSSTFLALEYSRCKPPPANRRIQQSQHHNALGSLQLSQALMGIGVA